MNTTEYTTKEMKDFLANMKGKYDLARVVDPTECRILTMNDNGQFSLGERCYGIWQSGQRCVNCSSAIACKTGCHREKNERFQDQIYHIESKPVKLILADGETYDVAIELVSIRKEEEVTGHVNERALEDISDSAIRYLADYDTLTSTLKEESFYEKTRAMLNHEADEEWMMITADILQFRLFNNLFGVEKGNAVLVGLADQLREITIKNLGICGRLRGDKFALLLRKKDFHEEPLIKAAHFMNTHFSSGVYTLCVHFGVYEITDKAIPVPLMCDRANMALRTIHSNLNATIAHFEDMIIRQGLIEQEILSSFEKSLEDGRFVIYLQSINNPNGKPLSAEALARWINEDGSVIPPDSFIPTLEKASFIHKLDKFVWEQAVRKLASWDNDLTLSVNISPKDFYCLDVYDVISSLCRQYNVPCERLRLEITESAMIENPSKVYPVIEKLQNAGFLIEIDDFGTGQSSLGLLKDLKADVLKIDRAFLRETENTRRSQIILQSVISMAIDLGMQIIVEGVETSKQLNSLISMGCECFQGFYFSRPLPIPEFEEKYLAVR